MWLTFEPSRQKRQFALDVAAVNLGMSGQQNAVDSALRKFDQ